MFKFSQYNFGLSRNDLIEFEFKDKEELFAHYLFANYAKRTIFHRFSLKDTPNYGVVILGEYYGGTEWHKLGRIEGDVSQLDIPFNETSWMV